MLQGISTCVHILVPHTYRDHVVLVFDSLDTDNNYMIIDISTYDINSD